jgi:hypothetical protein
MKRGSVVVDVSIDQGGCFETSRPTTHSNPTYVVDGVVHYCVTNMPGAVPRTSTFGLNNATLPFTLALADKGWRRALTEDQHLRDGLNVCCGHVTYKAVADLRHGVRDSRGRGAGGTTLQFGLWAAGPDTRPPRPAGYAPSTTRAISGSTCSANRTCAMRSRPAGR